MTANFRPRRSVLYMPGSNSRALEKARELRADCLIFDLEDAVAPEAKDMARTQVEAALRAGGYGRSELIVRTNSVDSEWFAADIAAVGACRPDAVLLPKVETAAMVYEALRQLSNAGAPADLPIWIMTETPRGVMDLDAILTSQPQIRVIVMGTSDLAKEMRINPAESRAGLTYALSQCVLTARAHGLDIIDGVQLALDDAEGLKNSCLQGRELGFDGKSLIHPRQIAVANEHFGVSAAEAASAHEIVNAWQTARKEGRGLTVVGGQLIEQLHVDEAERLLAIFAATEQ
jgi:citrate lyase subunit beta/citryl-CoA lyase